MLCCLGRTDRQTDSERARARPVESLHVAPRATTHDLQQCSERRPCGTKLFSHRWVFLFVRRERSQSIPRQRAQEAAITFKKKNRLFVLPTRPTMHTTMVVLFYLRHVTPDPCQAPSLICIALYARLLHGHSHSRIPPARGTRKTQTPNVTPKQESFALEPTTTTTTTSGRNVRCCSARTAHRAPRTTARASEAGAAARRGRACNF